MDAAAARPRSALALAAVVAAVAALAHARSIACGFVILDDPYYILENALVRGGFSAGSLAYAFALDGHHSYFHPLTWLSLMLDVELFGVKAWAFHAGNVALHAGTAALLFLVLRRFARDAVAATAAVLFAVHPLGVEAVAWVAERKTVMSAFLGTAAVLCYLRYGERRTPYRYGGALALHALSLLAKPGFVLLPVVLLALDWWPLRRLARGRDEPGRARILLEKLPFACASAIVVAVAVVSARGSTPHNVGTALLGRRTLTAFALVPEYLRAIAWPANLVVFRPYPRELDPVGVAIGVAVALAVTAGSILVARRHPSVPVGWCWFLATVAPYLGLHQAGMWPSWADRFAYVPMMGVALAAAGVADRLLGTRPVVLRRGAAGLAVIAGIALAGGTWAQIAVWNDSVVLFRRAVELAPANGGMQFRLGTALLAAGRAAEARGPLEAAVRLTVWSPDPYVVLGQLEETEGRFAEAERAYLAALRINPRYPPALYSYAQFLSRRGRDARPYFARFMQVAPPEWAAQRSAAAEHLK